MKLFITNKKNMEEDLPISLQQEAHKEGFKELRNHILSKNSIPLELFFEVGIHNYVFKLVKCDHEKEIYQYEYLLMVIG